jgi:hypothetical protein
MSQWGFVYCLANESLPGIYKVGYTLKSPIGRAQELSRSTGVPTPFEVYFYIEVTNPAEVERLIHHEMEEFRLSASREFFEIDDREIYALFALAEDQQGTIAKSLAYEAMCAVREYELSHPPETRKGKGFVEFYAGA